MLVGCMLIKTRLSERSNVLSVYINEVSRLNMGVGKLSSGLDLFSACLICTDRDVGSIVMADKHNTINRCPCY